MEQAVCNPTNPHIMRLQLPCAAQELPLCGMFGAWTEIRAEVLTNRTLLIALSPATFLMLGSISWIQGMMCNCLGRTTRR